MTFVNAALLAIIGLLIIIAIQLVRLRKLTAANLQRLNHIDNMITEQKPRQHQVASKVGPTQAQVERPKVKQRYPRRPTGRISTAVHLLRKGGADRGDSQNNRLREDPDKVSKPQRKTRWVGGSETSTSGQPQRAPDSGR